MSKPVKMKEPSVVRTYDQDGFRKRAACICVNEDETKVLLVTSRKDCRQWIVPGGGVEPDETVEMAAAREVREEAGVMGELGRCLGVFENAERAHRTSVYVLRVTEELDEWDESRTFGRQRQWFSVEAAVAALHKPLQSNYVKLLLPPDHVYHSQPPRPLLPPTSPASQPNNQKDGQSTDQPIGHPTDETQSHSTDQLNSQASSQSTNRSLLHFQPLTPPQPSGAVNNSGGLVVNMDANSDIGNQRGDVNSAEGVAAKNKIGSLDNNEVGPFSTSDDPKSNVVVSPAGSVYAKITGGNLSTVGSGNNDISAVSTGCNNTMSANQNDNTMTNFQHTSTNAASCRNTSVGSNQVKQSMDYNLCEQTSSANITGNGRFPVIIENSTVEGNPSSLSDALIASQSSTGAQHVVDKTQINELLKNNGVPVQCTDSCTQSSPSEQCAIPTGSSLADSVLSG